MTAPGTTLAERAETMIRRLRDVESVSVRVEGQELREIHVMTSSERPAKNLVRDIQTALRTGLALDIDHRIVSIARAEAAARTESTARVAPRPMAEEPEPAPEVRGDRIRFESVNLFVSGARTQAQVELRWRGLPRIGSASGWSTRDESHVLVATATAAAVQEFLADPVALRVAGVEFVDIARQRLAVVSMALLEHRQEKLLTGSCAVEQDTPQAVVLASLGALNRVVSGLRVKEPTEYVLRPTAE
jgi:hypothetical protein